MGWRGRGRPYRRARPRRRSARGAARGRPSRAEPPVPGRAPVARSAQEAGGLDAPNDGAEPPGRPTSSRVDPRGRSKAARRYGGGRGTAPRRAGVVPTAGGGPQPKRPSRERSHRRRQRLRHAGSLRPADRLALAHGHSPRSRRLARADRDPLCPGARNRPVPGIRDPVSGPLPAGRPPAQPADGRVAPLPRLGGPARTTASARSRSPRGRPLPTRRSRPPATTMRSRRRRSWRPGAPPASLGEGPIRSTGPAGKGLEERSISLVREHLGRSRQREPPDLVDLVSGPGDAAGWSHRPIAHDLQPPLVVGVGRAGQFGPEDAAEPCLFLDLPEGAGLVRFARVNLPLRERPILTMRAVDEQNSEPTPIVRPRHNPAAATDTVPRAQARHRLRYAAGRGARRLTRANGSRQPRRAAVRRPSSGPTTDGLCARRRA